MTVVRYERALEVCRAAALRRDMSDEHAQWFADALVRTSLAGIDTHGLRLLPLYLRELDEGRARSKPAMRTVKSAGATLLLDAGNALGTVAGTHAAHLVSDLAAEHGVGIVGVANSNHFGAASVYGSIVASRGKVGLVTTSAAARMAPFNGRMPLFGTNPICFSAPMSDGPPFVFDMATSQISYSQIKHFRKQNLLLPLGWALDIDGETTQEPGRVHALSPLGGYKGQGLAMMVQILSCLFTEMPLDHELQHLDTGSFEEGRRIGHFFMAIDPSCFVDRQQFGRRVVDLLSTVRGAPARQGQEILVPGDPQARCAQARMASGIPMNPEDAEAFFAEEARSFAAGLLTRPHEEVA